MRMQSYGARLGVAATLAAWSCVALVLELTEQQAVSRALSRPAYVENDAARVDAVRGTVTQASRLPNPIVKLELRARLARVELDGADRGN